MRRVLTGLLTTALLTSPLTTSVARAAEPLPVPTTSRASVAADGTQANRESLTPALSGDGRFTAFGSYASNLVPGDTNGVQDVFVHDEVTGSTERVSVATDGTQGNDASFSPQISRDGRYVGWTSSARTLVADDTNNVSDVFVHDRQTGTTTRISVAPDGTQTRYASSNPSISADGRWVSFQSDAVNLLPGVPTGQVYVRDMTTGALTVASLGEDGSPAAWPGASGARITADGRFVSFVSTTPLVADDTNTEWDVYRRDLVTGTTTLVSVPAAETVSDGSSYQSSISADGRYIAFLSSASTMVPDDFNGTGDVFVRDVEAGITTRVSTHPDGSESSLGANWPDISADGRYIALDTRSYLSDYDGFQPAGQVFVKDRITGAVTIASARPDGGPSNNQSGQAAISPDGTAVAFYSYSTNLVDGDTNGAVDVYGQRRR